MSLAKTVWEPVRHSLTNLSICTICNRFTLLKLKCPDFPGKDILCCLIIGRVFTMFYLRTLKPSKTLKSSHTSYTSSINTGKKIHYTQIKKTVNTGNIPGMCVLTNHMRDLVTAENEWVLSHGIELFRNSTRFNLHQFILQKLEELSLSI